MLLKVARELAKDYKESAMFHLAEAAKDKHPVSNLKKSAEFLAKHRSMVNLCSLLNKSEKVE